jgi:uncharacterized protein (DUF58 family)
MTTGTTSGARDPDSRWAAARGGFSASFPGFTLRATRAFWAFLVLVPLLGFAALNTGNNSVYLLLAVAMGAFVASGTFSRHTLSRLRVEAAVPHQVFAGSPVRIELVVRNGSGWLPASLVACRLVGMPGMVVVPAVPPGGERHVGFPTVFPVRGLIPLPPVQVEVRLPLAFFTKIVRWPQHCEVLVYPRKIRVGTVRWGGAPREAETSSGRRNRRGGEVDQLREFRPGDDRRDIHWKQTARQQRAIVMERREPSLPARMLVLDRQFARHDDPVLRQRFDDLVSEVASSAVDELRRGLAVGLVVGQSVMPPATGAAHAHRLLKVLALVQPVAVGADPLPPSVAWAAVYRLAVSQ